MVDSDHVQSRVPPHDIHPDHHSNDRPKCFLTSSSFKYSILIQSNISYLVYLITMTMLIWGAYIFNDFPGVKSTMWIPVLIYLLLAVILIISIVFIDDKALTDHYSKILAGIVILAIGIIIRAGHKIIFTPANIFLLYALTLRIVLFLISRCMIIIGEWIHWGDNALINKALPPPENSQIEVRKNQISKRTKTERVLVILSSCCFCSFYWNQLPEINMI